ncbi:MAG: hypothetical protein J7480_05800 [Microbacteriaceae bacterium]|nr:hypothetical protein [Microbacteriaceae bacterium]
MNDDVRLRPDPDAPAPAPVTVVVPPAPERRRGLGWFGQLLLFGLLAFAVVVAAGLAIFFALTRPLVVNTHTETVDERFIGAIERTQQVALLSLQVQGIESKKRATTWEFPWGPWEVPGSERALFVQYSFAAKLGIDGADVRIEPLGDGRFRVAVPAFEFIGQDDVDLRIAVEANGALSWITPEIDEIAMADEILSGSSEAQYVADNRDTLQDQARDFYTGIAQSIDPEIELEFMFI